MLHEQQYLPKHKRTISLDAVSARRFVVGPPMRLPKPEEQPLTARLARAGSVFRELESVLHAASSTFAAKDYKNLVLHENAAGKATEAGRNKAWSGLRERYLMDPAVEEFLAFVSAMGSATDPRDRGLIAFLMFARNERLFREITLEHISPLLGKPEIVVDQTSVEDAIERRLKEQGIEWSPVTLETVRQHIMSALKDYGVVTGSQQKRPAELNPGYEVIVFAAQLGRLQGLTDRQILDSDWFKLLGLCRTDVINLLFAAARARKLRFRIQADVVEITLPEAGAAV